MPEPFDHPEWLFELEWDGFRAVAYIEAGMCRLVSRNGNIFKSFATLPAAAAAAIGGHDAILDGEIAGLDTSGHADFYPLPLLPRRPILLRFHLVWLDGRDLRQVPLVERKGADPGQQHRRRPCKPLG